MPRVSSIFVPQNGIFWVVFSSAEGFGRNSRSFLFRGTAGIPSEIPDCSSYSVFRRINFLSEIPNPSSESPWYPLESRGLISKWLLILYLMKLSNSF